MSRIWLVFATVVVTLATLLLVYLLEVPLQVVLTVGFGALCLMWLVVLLTVPWNVYFGAWSLIHDIRLSRERGIEVPAERETEARRIARRMLVAAIAAHLVSAGVIAVITVFSGAEVGYYFVGFYLLSTFLRPAGAYFRHLRKRIAELGRETTHPRDDVLTLKERVAALEAGLKRHDEAREEADLAAAERAERTAAALEELRRESLDRDRALEAELDAVGRRFEDAISTLTDNQELIAGVKAFLRLVREQRA
ncbi:hypothetical protein [Allonocardiopsis opalescens]|uniref:Uncharacterized protein n=1 Tax=Allonocardiopsis opalescens TaxID=1144618 RepID=A0A2T0QA09_9ACTN|nr:hypothetical protein [Allonocardiopsis opalescens]PRY00736.1 hypothetical protein CLV72_102368 [Allonocardiopsis opalescens]